MSTYSKTHLEFWKRRLRKPKFTRGGKREVAVNWSTTFSHAGRRVEWSLGTPNKEAAASKARDIYLSLVSRGWDQTLAIYRPKAGAPGSTERLTVGRFLEEAHRRADCSPQTVERYAKALRKIVSDIKGFKESHLGRARETWLARVARVPLDEITPGEVHGWKRAYIARAALNGPLAERSAKISVNSLIAHARGLFTAKHTRHFSFTVTSPFEGVRFEPRPSVKYHSGFDVKALIAKALAELDPERLKIFLLAVMAGLRRKEIDLLEWKSVRFSEHVIRIEPTEFFHPKSEHSLDDVGVDPELMEILLGFHARASGPFVIESTYPPKRVEWQYYRADHLFDSLSGWLREKGIKSQRPLHTLRKEFGSLINEAHGIMAASKALRHGSLAVSSQFYVESRKRATSGLGSLLLPERDEKVVPWGEKRLPSASSQG
jgi:integrase